MDYLEKNGPVAISQTEADELNAAVAPNIMDPLIAKYNAASSVPFDQLPPEAQTVIADVAYQYGPNLDLPAIDGGTPKFWGMVTQQNWQAAVNELNNFGDGSQSRRESEATLLQKCIPPTTQGGRTPGAQ